MQKGNLRYERKYIIPKYLEGYIYALIQGTSDQFYEEFNSRKVNSIYYDTDDFLLASHNINGSSNRYKFRLRNYNSNLNCFDNSILEIKYKKGSLGYKNLIKCKTNLNFNPQELLKNLFIIESIPQELVEFFNKLIPVLFVSYQRNYYRSYNSKYRITLDTKISYQAIDFLMSEKPLITPNPFEDNISILEIKYDSQFEESSFIKDLFLPLRLSKNSKYVRGLTITNKICLDL